MREIHDDTTTLIESADVLIRADNTLARVIAPFERIFGVTLLGRTVIGQIAQPLNVFGTGNGTGVILP